MYLFSSHDLTYKVLKVFIKIYNRWNACYICSFCYFCNKIISLSVSIGIDSMGISNENPH